MKPYLTVQRKMLLSFLRMHAGETLSAAEIATQIKQFNDISVSAVYRNLARLADAGRARKFLSADGRTILYQYRDPEKCDAHLHLKCTDCGTVFHMDEITTESVLETVLKYDAFFIDKKETILYGLCGECRRRHHIKTGESPCTEKK